MRVGSCINDIETKNIETIVINSGRSNLIAFKKVKVAGDEILNVPCKKPARNPTGKVSLYAIILDNFHSRFKL